MVRKGRIAIFFMIVLLIGSVIGYFGKTTTDEIKLGLDLQGGFEILYQVHPLEGDEVTEDMIKSAISALWKRIDVIGVAEPDIVPEGSDRIRVQLAGVEDQSEARDLLSTEANLTFRDVNDVEMMNGSELKSARLSYNEQNEPLVAITLKDAKVFEDITRKIKNMYPENFLVIWLDYEEGDSYAAELEKPEYARKFISAPRVNEVLTQKDIVIEGNFTVDEATNLAEILNAGALPVKLEEIYSQSVGAKLGEESMNKTIFAGAIGVALIFLFMIFYYRLPGVVAVVTLSAYIYLILVVFEGLNAVLTLPGIAALILGVGMAVDANIITYERIKEELRIGKTTLSAFRSGNRRSLATILDANITTILAAGVLFIFGTSSVKGFALMLIVSIVVSLITAVYGSRLLLGLWVNSRYMDKKPGLFGLKQEEIKDIANSQEGIYEPKYKFDFVSKRKRFFTASIGFIVIGLLSLLIFGLNLGIDFVSGTKVEITPNVSITNEQFESDLTEMDLKPNAVTAAGQNDSMKFAHYAGVFSKDEIANVKEKLQDKYGVEPNVSTVSPVVGQELAKNAFFAVLYASIGIVLYVTIRFEFLFGISAIVALLHDAFFIIVLFSMLHIEVNLYFIAAVLTIVGYSINDTIVTFDRIRENLKAKKKVKVFEDLVDVVNLSLQQTFERSLNTVLTVVFAALALFIFGSGAISGFSFALLVGLVAGTYSSLFIAAQLWLVLKWRAMERERLKPKKVDVEDEI
ncbi:protein translocase subunit SecDF [Lottiidibacillus patelloidae]|uniref:Multifunctional fusion protein n=1 Tax=Lottiidibacillus patelloidae TaxID=2670334 RepID=A0A263BVS9_9BACI|nr:protein translocase subunit SecDF [Lottiidibacillus patelloidae]OZM57829.1 protein translocase subunit SecDF [Lottiidibacillus patelloidae]